MADASTLLSIVETGGGPSGTYQECRWTQVAPLLWERQCRTCWQVWTHVECSGWYVVGVYVGEIPPGGGVLDLFVLA